VAVFIKRRTLGQKLGLLQSPSADQLFILNKLPWHSDFLDTLHMAVAVLAPLQHAPEQNMRELHAVFDADHVPSQSASATLLEQPQSLLQQDPTGSRVGCVCSVVAAVSEGLRRKGPRNNNVQERVWNKNQGSKQHAAEGHTKDGLGNNSTAQTAVHQSYQTECSRFQIVC
jgi:hypothetical protein